MARNTGRGFGVRGSELQKKVIHLLPGHGPFWLGSLPNSQAEERPWSYTSCRMALTKSSLRKSGCSRMIRSPRHQ